MQHAIIYWSNRDAMTQLQLMIRNWLFFVANERKERAYAEKVSQMCHAKETYQMIGGMLHEKLAMEFTALLHQALFDAWLRVVENKKHSENVHSLTHQRNKYRHLCAIDVHKCMHRIIIDREALGNSACFAAWRPDVLREHLI